VSEAPDGSEEPGDGVEIEQRFEIVTPDAQVAGVHADLVGVWHTPDSFVFDFSVVSAPASVRVEGGRRVVTQPAQVVSRVRMPPGQIFEVMRALEQQLSSWERENGR
jgi:Protein of unknown function (DUF3467)